MIARLGSRRLFYLLVVGQLVGVIVLGLFFPVDSKTVATSFARRNMDYFQRFAAYPKNLEQLRVQIYTDHLGYSLGEDFALSSHYTDQIAYMDMALGQSSIAPYRFRPLYPLMIQGMLWIEERILAVLSPSLHARFLAAPYRRAFLNFQLANGIILIACAAVAARIARQFTRNEGLILGYVVLICSQFAVIRTAPFAMVDCAVLLLMLLSLNSLLKRHWGWLSIIVALGVLTKESLVIWTPALIALAWEQRERTPLLVALVPACTFIIIRLALGDAALSVSYDLNPLTGDFTFYYLYMHLGAARGWVNLILGWLAAFGVLWLYLPTCFTLRQRGLLAFFIVFLSLLVVAQLLLASRVARSLAPLYPWFALLPLLAVQHKFKASELRRPAMPDNKTASTTS